MGELSKLMSEGWKGCTEGEREQCEAKAAEEKIQYDAALEAYTPSETYKAAMVRSAPHKMWHWATAMPGSGWPRLTTVTVGRSATWPRPRR